MANGRGYRSKIDKGRDGGRFMAIPFSVLESPAYLGLSSNARSLLLEVAFQFHGDDNGRLLLSRAHLKSRGWNSTDQIAKGKRELLDAELIFETVKGHRPNKASWYALTWRNLDKLKGLDVGVEAAFERGAYRKSMPLPNLKERPDWTLPNGGRKNDVSTPPGGTGNSRIAPPGGTETSAHVPPGGTVRGVLPMSPVPLAGHPLEVPSVSVRVGAGVGNSDARNASAENRTGASTSGFTSMSLLEHARRMAARSAPPPASPATTDVSVMSSLDALSRVRDHDLDPASFDPETGECIARPPAPARSQRQAAQAWVSAALSKRAG